MAASLSISPQFKFWVLFPWVFTEPALTSEVGHIFTASAGLAQLDSNVP